MTRLELVAWVLVMALLGAGVGLVVLRPWDHHVALSLSGSQTSSLQAGGSPSAGATRATCPDVAVRKKVQPPTTIPRGAWVHASDGVNVRAAPSSSATRLTTLAVGTALTVQEEQTNPDGSTWYRIRLSDGADGWLNGAFTTNFPISPAPTDSLKIWLPAGYQFQTAASGKAEARFAGAPLALLYFQTGAVDQAPMEMAVQAGLPLRSTWRQGPDQQVLVGDLPATDRVFSITLAGGGCPALIHEVRVSTASRYYIFRFLVDAPSSSVVAQLLDSATVQ